MSMLCRNSVALGIAPWLAVSFSTPSFAGAGTVESKIDLRVSPALDMHFQMRSLSRKVDDQIPAAFRPAVAAVRTIDKSAEGGGLTWGVIDSALNDCRTAKQILDVFSTFSETYRSKFGQPSDPVPLRAPAVALAEEYVKLEPEYLRDHWPARKRSIEERLADATDHFLPKVEPCLVYMLEHLGMQDPRATIPVYLVVDMHWPGASTYKTDGGGALCIVGINREDFEGGLLYETILHEATHALDIVTGSESVFEGMRDKMLAAGVPRRNRLFHDVPHTVMFVQAAETIRRVVDPAHVHYGVVSRYYDRISRPGEPVGDKVREVWIRYLDGAVTRSAAVDELVSWTAEKAKLD